LDRLKKRGVEITVFHEPFTSIDDAVAKLRPPGPAIAARCERHFRAIDRAPAKPEVHGADRRAASSLDDKARPSAAFHQQHARRRLQRLDGGARLALLMSCARDLAKASADAGWRLHDGIKGMQVLEGKRLGVLGLGRLGSRVAGYAKAFAWTSSPGARTSPRKRPLPAAPAGRQGRAARNLRFRDDPPRPVGPHARPIGAAISRR